jgi:parallel beta-helix repeat protein
LTFKEFWTCVQIADSGRGVYEGNDVSKNYEAGIRIESKACPLIEKENRIHSGRYLMCS